MQILNVVQKGLLALLLASSRALSFTARLSSPLPRKHNAVSMLKSTAKEQAVTATTIGITQSQGDNNNPVTEATDDDESSVLEVTMIPPQNPQEENNLRPSYGAVELWKRRLITREDPFSIHKLSSAVYSLSAVIILATGGIRFLTSSPEEFAQIPAFLEIPSYLFVASTLIMCGVSMRMSFLHRKFDLVARNAFLGTAVSSLFSGYYFLWTSPFAPELFNNQLFSSSCFGTLVALNIVFIMDTLLQIPQVVESRRDRKAEVLATNNNNEDVQMRFWKDAVGYVLPIAWGLPVVISTGYINSILHDRPWFLEQCQYIDAMTGQQGIQASICYLQVLASMAASYGSLFVTLRDKKLISKQQELAWITVFSVPAMIWTIYVSVVFFTYLFDVH